MTVLRMAVSLAVKGAGTGTSSILGRGHVTLLPNQVAGHNMNVMWQPRQLYSISQVTKNIKLISSEGKVKFDEKSKMRINSHTGKETKRLVVVLSWLLAKEKHIIKYASFYMDHGFDVLTVEINPWQLLWPVKGTQIVAGELAQFLQSNPSYQQLLLHGFSVGGYVWAESLVIMDQELARYRAVVDRIVGQIWDSAADISELPVGFPKAVFPRNLVLQSALQKYMRYHLKTFHDSATKHYIRASQMFHTTLVRAPALFLFSKTDPVGSEESNMRVLTSWESCGMKCFRKCWDKSPHVGHYRKHPEEYIAELNAFLERVGLIKNAEKLQAKL